jgi:hypothetical protein
MKRFVLAVGFCLAALGVGCGGGKSCEKLLQHYCEDLKGKPNADRMCKMFTSQVEAGMSQEGCERTLANVK